MFFIIEKSEETTFEFPLNAATIVWFWPCIKMEIQNIISLLGDVDNESSKFATRKWHVINDQNNTDYDEGNESLKPKSLNQVFVIIQTHIFL